MHQDLFLQVSEFPIFNVKNSCFF